MSPDGSGAAAEIVRLNRPQCLQLLASVPVGRLIFTINALPAVRPLNFVLAGNLIVVRTAASSAAARKAAGTIVAFEADELDPATCSGWSVTATGKAELVTDHDTIARYTSLRLVPWAPGTRDQLMTIGTDLIEGQRPGTGIGTRRALTSLGSAAKACRVVATSRAGAESARPSSPACYLGLLVAAQGHNAAAAAHFAAATAQYLRLGALPGPNKAVSTETASASSPAGPLPAASALRARSGPSRRRRRDPRSPSKDTTRSPCSSPGPDSPSPAGELPGNIAPSRGEPALDRQALAAYRARLHDLDDDIAETEIHHDLERATHARLALTAELTRSRGPRRPAPPARRRHRKGPQDGHRPHPPSPAHPRHPPPGARRAPARRPARRHNLYHRAHPINWQQ